MAHVVVFHHVQGLTPGMHALAERLASTGHRVTMPDLLDGATFATVDDGVAHVEAIGFEQVIARGEAAVAALDERLIYWGLSLGAMPAQKLAQTRPGAQAVVLCHGAVPLSAFGGTWPRGVPLQIHAKEDDELAEVDVLRDLAAAVPGAELHLYPGDAHLFTDESLDDYDDEATNLVFERALALLDASE